MSEQKLLIKNGRVIDPALGLDDVRDILVSRGKIEKIDTDLKASGAEIFDASGKLVMPGFIDMHVHLREPGAEEAETIASGCNAAARGGFTAVCAMPNTTPATDDAGRVEFILDRAAGQKARVYPIGAVTRGRDGRELVEMADMAEAGAAGFSDDGCSVANTAVMLNALRYAGMIGRPIIGHEEEPSLDAGGQMNDGALSAELGLKGMPSLAEDIMVARDIALAEYAGTPFHVTHISTQGTVDIIRRAKARGLQITCDVTPHHIALTEELVETFDTRYKMNPPLRTRVDVDAIIQGLKDGTIDVIATDHAPHYIENKETEFIYAAFGVTGLETAIAVVQQTLVDTGILNWGDVVQKMSATPARILGVPGGTLAEGGIADITIYDPAAQWTVDPENMVSKSRNTAFFGRMLPGQAAATVLSGTLV